MAQPIVLCDVDGVVADLLTEGLRRYNEKWGDNLTPADIRKWDLMEAVKPEFGRRVYDILREPDLYDAVLPVDGAVNGVNALRLAGFRVVFVTSWVTGTTDAKVRWLTYHGFLPSTRYSERDFVAAHDKALVRGDVLIDDAIHNVESYPGPTILFDQPYNRDFAGSRRARGWADVVRMVRGDARSPQYDFLDHLREGAD